MTIIHYIIAICTTHSVKNSIITGMAYGYFGITIAVIIVVAIFLLLASDGDIDFDLSGDAGEGSKSKSNNISHKPAPKDTPVSKVAKESSRVKDIKASMPTKKPTIDPMVGDMILGGVDVALDGLDTAMYTAAAIDEVKEDRNKINRMLKELDELYEKGAISYEKYKRMRNDLLGIE